jgi:hypothetical protein
MTNLLAIATITVVTNWTGVTSQGKELGYLSTNHDITLSYQKTTNVVQAKRELSSVAVWREQQFITTNWTGGIIFVK